jgi:hypothetical protein
LFRDVIAVNGEDNLDITFSTNEAWFHVSCYVNSQHNCICSMTNPHEIKDPPLHDQKVGVWCAKKLGNQPHILWWHQLRTLLWSDSLPLHWTFMWGQNCQQLLSTGCYYCTHTQLIFPWCYCKMCLRTE